MSAKPGRSSHVAVFAVPLVICLSLSFSWVMAQFDGQVTHSAVRDAASSEASVTSAINLVVRALSGDSQREVVRLELPQTVGAQTSVAITLDGQPFTLSLKPHSVRAEGFRLLLQVAGGSLVAADPGPSRTVRGSIVGVPGSVVAGSLLDEGLYASIRFPDGRTYWIEPIARLLPIEPTLHMVYQGSEAVGRSGTCGMVNTRPGPGAQVGDGDGAIPTGAGSSVLYLAELACDADYDYYLSYNSNVQDVTNRIELIVTTVNLEYESQVDTRHVITAIIVRTDSHDPYVGDLATRLQQFRNYWNTNHTNIPRDLAHLFTAGDYGGTYGLAIGSRLVCQTEDAYCIAWSDFNPDFNRVTNLTAHEMGHLWDATHCDLGAPACDCPYTMDSCVSSPNNEFIYWNVDRIVDARDNGAFLCLSCEVTGGCPWDLDGDSVVGIVDFLDLLAKWGPCTCQADFDCDENVGIVDFLQLLANWGPCPQSGLPEPLTLAEELADACLTQDNWDEYVGVMTDESSSQAKKDRYDCWMRHHISYCPACTCGPEHCSGVDPFS